jgi:hypothetical protein
MQQMADEKKKLAYLIMRVRTSSSSDMFDALDGEWFDNAESVMHAFVDNSSDAWDQYVAAQEVMRLDSFLENWEPSDDYLRH